ncbi:HAD-IA family hydrolase [Planctomycetota bacterium]|nr:HAD-IA family hydrolase [Planctomycetota bacterium]
MRDLDGILFDLGGVLCNVDESRVWQLWQEHTGCNADVLQQELFDRDLKDYFDKGLKPPGMVAFFLAARFDVDLSLDDWKRIWCSSLSVNPEMNELATIAASQLPTVTASTTDETHWGYISPQLSCLNRFTGHALSFEIGEIKPHGRFYLQALEKLGTQAGKTLFIDDRPENIAGAKEMGLQTYHFDNAPNLRVLLQTYGLIF